MQETKKKKPVILRADGNSRIGLGHVYRSLALAEMLKDDFDCSFAITDPDVFTLDQIEKTCKKCIRLQSNVVARLPDDNVPAEEMAFDLECHLSGNEIVVTDGYLFGEKYQLAVKATGAKLVCIDDLALTNFYADVIINHAPGVDVSVYKKQEYTKLYTGLDYAILRQPFFSRLPKRKNAASVAFISMGGSDYYGYSKKLLELLLPFNKFESIQVLCSSSFQSELLNTLEEMETESQKIKLHFNLSAKKIVEVLDSSTHAFVSASTVLMEAYSRGLQCFIGFYNNNQSFTYNGFINENRATGLGDLKKLDFKIMNSALKGVKNFTGLEYGPKKKPTSSDNLREIFTRLDFNFRKATYEDVGLYFDWVNDLEVRKNAFDSKQITWENHKDWFDKKIRSFHSKLFILEVTNNPVGQIRIDSNEDDFWIIDYSIENSCRNLGYGKKLMQFLLEKEPNLNYKAFVKPNNKNSQLIFESLGFTKFENRVDEEPAFCYIKEGA